MNDAVIAARPIFTLILKRCKEISAFHTRKDQKTKQTNPQLITNVVEFCTIKVPTKASMQIQSEMSSSTTLSLKTLLYYDAYKKLVRVNLLVN